MPGVLSNNVYNSYVVWTVVNLVLTGLTCALFAYSEPQNITVEKDNLLSYYPGFWDAVKGKYNNYTNVTAFKSGSRLSLKALADPGKCTKANAAYCYGNEATGATRMWYTYRFSQNYTNDNSAVLDNNSISIIPMFIHNDDRSASVRKIAFVDDIEGDRIYSPAECYEVVRSYNHIFSAQSVIMVIFVLYHIFVFLAYGVRTDGNLENVIPVVFDVSIVIYGIALFHFVNLIVQINENQRHCKHLSGWFGNSNHSMHTYVVLNLVGYLIALLLAIWTAYLFKIYSFEFRKGSRTPRAQPAPVPVDPPLLDKP